MIWEKIYQNYQKGGQPWGSLDEGITTQFIEFVEQSEFTVKSAFDIGVGTGKYLAYLQAKGFTIAGVDSSKTAVQIAQKELGEAAHIVLGDMYAYAIPPQMYDCIFSISTIHHGSKEQIARLIARICGALLPGGYIFITLPTLKAKDSWKTFRDSKKVAPGTFVPTVGPEKDLPHSFFTKREVEQLFSQFKDISIIEDDRQRWIIKGKSYV